MSLRGERHVNICLILAVAKILVALNFSCLHHFLLRFSFTLPSPIIQYQIQGEKEFISRDKNLWNSLHIFNPWGHGYIQMKY